VFESGAKLPSTGFCLLLRLFTLRCTEKQMTLMLQHVDSPYIRCIGFLFLRYATDPDALWQWFEPYLYDEEQVQVAASNIKPPITLGRYVRSLLTDMDYYGTLLPRLPVAIERELKVKLLQAEKIEARAKGHLKDESRMAYFTQIGSRIRGLYGDEENPTTWYDAVVDRVILRDEETSQILARPKFVVTFSEYGNTEQVSLGDIDLVSSVSNGGGGLGPSKERESISSSRGGVRDSREHGRNRDQDWSRSNDRYGRGRDDIQREAKDSRHVGRGYADSRPGYSNQNDNNHRGGMERHWERDRGREDHYGRGSGRGSDHHPESNFATGASANENEKDLMEEVLRREREKSAAHGRVYASRPSSFKNSLTGEQPRRTRSRSPDRGQTRNSKTPKEGGEPSTCAPAPSVASTKREMTPQELVAVEQKKRKLMSKYG